MRSERGFTLLEVLVATAIMGVAVAGLLNAISGSARNASRLNQYDRAVMLAKSKMDELLAEPELRRNVPMAGVFDAAKTGGVECSWRAVVQPFETVPGAAPGYWVVDRVGLEIGWMDGATNHSFSLEGFRRGILRDGDVQP
ncbi:MAG TPA: prepilin-type N-terminal cleavage/methylation domain-containing protein [Bryobacteraceae bacterium]|nr:prepilin-type N-terminal cleavage/methylation domain-containing protein [Bryobacteraceae bacterium]